MELWSSIASTIGAVVGLATAVVALVGTVKASARNAPGRTASDGGGSARGDRLGRRAARPWMPSRRRQARAS